MLPEANKVNTEPLLARHWRREANREPVRRLAKTKTQPPPFLLFFLRRRRRKAYSQWRREPHNYSLLLLLLLLLPPFSLPFTPPPLSLSPLPPPPSLKSFCNSSCPSGVWPYPYPHPTPCLPPLFTISDTASDSQLNTRSSQSSRLGNSLRESSCCLSVPPSAQASATDFGSESICAFLARWAWFAPFTFTSVLFTEQFACRGRGQRRFSHHRVSSDWRTELRSHSIVKKFVFFESRSLRLYRPNHTHTALTAALPQWKYERYVKLETSVYTCLSHWSVRWRRRRDRRTRRRKKNKTNELCETELHSRHQFRMIFLFAVKLETTLLLFCLFFSWFVVVFLPHIYSIVDKDFAAVLLCQRERSLQRLISEKWHEPCTQRDWSQCYADAYYWPRDLSPFFFFPLSLSLLYVGEKLLIISHQSPSAQGVVMVWCFPRSEAARTVLFAWMR